MEPGPTVARLSLGITGIRSGHQRPCAMRAACPRPSRFRLGRWHVTWSISHVAEDGGEWLQVSLRICLHNHCLLKVMPLQLWRSKANPKAHRGAFVDSFCTVLVEDGMEQRMEEVGDGMSHVHLVEVGGGKSEVHGFANLSTRFAISRSTLHGFASSGTEPVFGRVGLGQGCSAPFLWRTAWSRGWRWWVMAYHLWPPLCQGAQVRSKSVGYGSGSRAPGK